MTLGLEIVADTEPLPYGGIAGIRVYGGGLWLAKIHECNTWEYLEKSPGDYWYKHAGIDPAAVAALADEFCGRYSKKSWAAQAADNADYYAALTEG